MFMVRVVKITVAVTDAFQGSMIAKQWQGSCSCENSERGVRVQGGVNNNENIIYSSNL